MRTTRALAVTVLAGATALAPAIALAPAAAAGTAAAVTLQEQQVTAQDEAFLVTAHQGNLAEIAAGRLAQERAGSEQVREHGRIFVRDHTALDEQVQALAERLGVELPGEPTPEQQREAARLAQLSGAEFDRAWTVQQIAAHRASLANVEREQADGDNADAVALAAAAEPTITAHLEMLLAHGDVPDSVDAGAGGLLDGGTAPLALSVALLAGGAAVAGAGVVVLRRGR